MHEAITKAAAEIENTAAIEVTAVGGFSVGGHEHDGRYEGQTYVQYVRQARPSSAFPLLLLHGGGLTGACFGDTPDGRPGWQWDFLRAGLDVLVADGAGYGRASYRPQPPVPSLLRDRQALWDLFRVGYPDTRFPTAAFDAFLQQVVPVGRDHDLPALRQAGYDALLNEVGPCLLLTHSAAGPYGFRSSLKLPETIRAHIAVEPSGAPDPRILTASPIPHLFLWGDHLDDDPMWRGEYASARRFHDALCDLGADSEWIDLPAHGITGNSHLLMMDDNSPQLSAMLCDWLRRKGLVAPHPQTPK